MEEFSEEVKKKVMCFASFPTDSGGVRFADCQDPERGHHCIGCPAHEALWGMRDKFRKEGHLTDQESFWLAHEFFDIPDAYLCDGEIESWERVNLPTRYKKTLARQKELVRLFLKPPKPEPKPEDPEPEQMNIFDFLGG